MKRKVLFCGTHPYQFNGYSKVVYELSKELAKYDDIKLYIWGFQNFYDVKDHVKERELPDTVEIYDAYKNEEPKNKGFGEKLFCDYVKQLSPDIVIVYNDLIVITTLLKNLGTIQDRKFKIVPYIDIVYKNEKQGLIDFICSNSDGGIAFTEYWKECLIEQNFSKKLWTVEHGFNRNQYFPVPKHVARKYFELNQDDFIILNLNRNQPRKRWDHCIMAYVKFVSKHIGEKVKLLVMTSVEGAWNLIELLNFEGKRYGLSMQQLKSHFIFIQNPQKLRDFDINIMYNAADIGFNTCDGEGFGLCNFEQAGVGVPQVVPFIGGFRDFFNDNNSICLKPITSIYGDGAKDAVGGEMELCAIDDYVMALEKYYTNVELRKQHGKQARADIIKYNWVDKAKKFHQAIIEATNDLYPPQETTTSIMDNINKLLSIDKNNEKDLLYSETKSEELVITEIEDIKEIKKDETKKDETDNDDDDDDIDIDALIEEKLKINDNKKKDMKDDVRSTTDVESMTKDELVILQKKIATLLNK